MRRTVADCNYVKRGPYRRGEIHMSKYMSLDTFVSTCITEGVSLEEAKEALEREYLLTTLRESGNNACACADKIGVHRNTLSRRLHRLGIFKPRKWNSRPLKF